MWRGCSHTWLTVIRSPTCELSRSTTPRRGVSRVLERRTERPAAVPWPRLCGSPPAALRVAHISSRALPAESILMFAGVGMTETYLGAGTRSPTGADVLFTSLGDRSLRRHLIYHKPMTER